MKLHTAKLLFLLNLLMSRLSALFAQTATKIHTARFARLHELSDILSDTLPTGSLIMGLGIGGGTDRVLRVKPTKQRREMGNLLVVAPTRGGKGLLAVSQLLTWRHSVIVNDIKGELYDQTAGYRRTLGPVFVFDPDGRGDRFDPLATRTSEKDLLSAATHLLHRPGEGEGRIFTERATVMLTQLFLAARAQNLPLLPYAGQMVRLGLIGTAKELFRVAPTLATQFLDCELQDANFDDRFLVSAWGTLAARLRLLLTDSVVRSFSATDFTAEEIMQGSAPVTVYLSWPERDLLMLAPLMRLMWDCFINELVFTYDNSKGDNCRPVLLLIDEAGVSPIPNLPRFASTVCGRGMSLWVAVQALSQLEALYGKHGAETLINNCDTQIYYRQSSQGTAEYLERCLGKQSGFAHSQSLHDGEEKSQGLAEQAVALMTAQEVKQLDYTDIVGFYANRPPFKAKRMDWRGFPVLRQRRSIPAPPLTALAPLEESFADRGEATPGNGHTSSWQLPPALTRRGSPVRRNGFAKNGNSR